MSSESSLRELQIKTQLALCDRQRKEAAEVISALHEQVRILEAKLGYTLELGEHATKTHVSIKGTDSRDSQSVAVVQASDWHMEETVVAATVNGLNSFNLRVAETRIRKFFNNIIKLVNLQRNATQIDELVLHLGGDLITGYIHLELIEGNSLSPTQAVLKVLDLLKAGLELILDTGDFKKVTCVCSIGNHGRTTVKRQISTGYKNSFEWLLYHVLAKAISDPRVQFVIDPGYHSYVKIYGSDYRFHHGDAFKFGGGVGGITIPVLKKIAQWDKVKPAKMDFFGHFHQHVIHSKFICNGALIGYGPFSLEIGAEFETPRQSFSLIEKEHGRTIVAPIFLD